MGYQYTDEKRKHLHTLDGKPLFGTSTVVGVLNKPLTWWAAGMACAKFGWVNSKLMELPERMILALKRRTEIAGMSEEQYMHLLDGAYKAHNEKKKDSAEAGTDMHAELEKYVKDCIVSYGGTPQILTRIEHRAVEMFSNWAVENVETFLWSEGHTYSEKHWVGGIVDAGAKMKSGSIAVIDFKSSKEAYYSQFVQIGGYTMQIAENGILDARGNKVLDPVVADEMIVIPFGAAGFSPDSRRNVPAFQEAFIGCLVNHKLSQVFEEVSKMSPKGVVVPQE